MPRAKKVNTSDQAPTLAGDATPSSDTVIMSKEEFEKNSNPTKTSFDVFDKDGVFVRTYTLEIHGENAEALANEFASHTGGKVV